MGRALGDAIVTVGLLDAPTGSILFESVSLQVGFSLRRHWRIWALPAGLGS